MGISRRVASAALVIFALGCWFSGSWIHIKAELAQYLIKRSWALTAPGETSRPWPWADTWPVARLTHSDEDLIVLAGAHGSSLAFGPGHVDGTAAPGEAGVSVIAGHRDTHFEFLRDIREGDHMQLQTPDGRWHTYIVSDIEVVDSDVDDGIVLLSNGARLVLVTCYPFDAITVGGPLRYLVKLDRLIEDTPVRDQPARED